MSRRVSKGRCPFCGVPTFWRWASWVVDDVTDAAGRTCSCCSARKVMQTTVYHEDGRVVLNKLTRPVFVPLGQRLDKIVGAGGA